VILGSLRKVLIIPKGQPESVNQRADNAMAQKDKIPCNDLQNTIQKTTNLVTPTPLKSGVIWYFDPHGILSTGQCLPMVY
jgi:hypothetical protein